MTESERLEFLISALEGGKKIAFAQRVGMSPAHLHKLLHGTHNIKFQIPHICRAYPQINRQWLESGEGYPGDLTVDLVKRHYQEKIEKADKIIDHLMRRIDELEKCVK